MNLKQEMRQRFEKRPSMDFNIRNFSLEEGLLEKIINLSFINLRSYSSKLWSITVVKSPIQLQKLYRLVADTRITLSALAMIISNGLGSDAAETDKNLESDLGLLLLSLTYAAKYYCIDSFNITEFNKDPIEREFALDRNKNILAIKCFGIFDIDSDTICLPNGQNYSNIVKVI
jgi:hypothetical protein